MQAKIGQYSFLFLGVLALSTSAIFVKLAAAPSSVTALFYFGIWKQYIFFRDIYLC